MIANTSSVVPPISLPELRFSHVPMLIVYGGDHDMTVLCSVVSRMTSNVVTEKRCSATL